MKINKSIEQEKQDIDAMKKLRDNLVSFTLGDIVKNNLDLDPKFYQPLKQIHDLCISYHDDNLSLEDCLDQSKPLWLELEAVWQDWKSKNSK